MSVTIKDDGVGAEVYVVARASAIAEAAVRAIQADAERMIVERLATTSDAAGHVGRQDTGAAGQAVQVGPIAWEGGVCRGSVEPSGPAAAYWPVLEDGRRPNRPIGLEGRLRIQTWVRRKILPRAVGALRLSRSNRNAFGAGIGGKGGGRVSKDEQAELLDSLTFLVVRKIRRQGTPGIHPFKRSAEELRGGRAVMIYESAALGARRTG